MFNEFENINKRIEYSDKKIELLRKTLKDICPSNATVVISGSFARKEASEESDLDYYILCRENDNCADTMDKIKNSLLNIDVKLPAVDGAFANIESIDQMVANIGGIHDDNAKITRRLLFLLEGDWLCNENLFNEFREKIIFRYIQDGTKDHQISRFLLNDLIRFYRTMCVDYEYKTQEIEKPWAIRNLKLIFSRKLIYFSGVLVVAESAQSTFQEKRKTTNELLCLTPLARIAKVCETHRAKKTLSHYDYFLGKLSDKNFRADIEKVTQDRGSHDAIFRDVKNRGHHFSWELMSLLKNTYDCGHPIHNALVI